MLAFEIEVDGQPIALIGKRDWAILNVIIGALRDTDLKKDVPTVELRLGGLTLDDSDGVCHHFYFNAFAELRAILHRYILIGI